MIPLPITTLYCGVISSKYLKFSSRYSLNVAVSDVPATPVAIAPVVPIASVVPAEEAATSVS